MAEDHFVHCRAEQVRDRLSNVLCTQFQVVQKQKSKPSTFLRIRSVNTRMAGSQPPAFLARRAKSESRLASEVPRSSCDPVEPPFGSVIVNGMIPVTAADQAELSQVSGAMAQSELFSFGPCNSHNPSQMQPELGQDSRSVSALETDGDATAAVRPF